MFTQKTKMSITKKLDRIAIFHNLPGGGGIRMLNNIILECKKYKEIDMYVIGESDPVNIPGVQIKYQKVRPWSGFLFRNLWIIFVLPHIHQKLAKEINKNYKFILLTHDYFTKSPYLLRYIKINNAYICNEPQREFYENRKIHAPEIRNQLTNVLRYPIKIIDEINVRYAKTIICNSKYTKKVFKKIYKRKSDLIYPGVNCKYFITNKSKREKMILCVGGINPVKDQLFLVESLKPILHQYKLILVGNGKKSYIKKIIIAGGKDSQIKIINHVSEDRLRYLYQKSMVTCISAHLEPFGLSSIESQACGTPVVSVREGGPMESIVVGKTGYLAQRDHRDFLNKVLLTIKHGKKMRKYSRSNAVNNWSWGITLKNVSKYLE